MGKKVNLTPDDLSKMCKLYEEGFGGKYLSALFGVCGATTRKCLLANDITLRKYGKGATHTDVVKKMLADRQRGFKFSDESKLKMSLSHKGIPLSEEHKRKVSRALKGKKKKPEAIEKVRKCHIGMKWSESTRLKINRFKSQEHRDKLSKALKGRPNLALKGKKQSDSVIKEKSLRMKNLYASEKGPALREISRERASALWKRDDFVKKQMDARYLFPNKTELLLMSFLDNIFPKEWKYVGDGQVIINGKCPDFINVNGQKKIIELFGDYWHRGQDPKDRADIFAPFGYKTLVVWERELKDLDKLKNKLINFKEG